MEVWGFEPQTSGLQSPRSSQLSYTPAYFFTSLNRTLEYAACVPPHKTSIFQICISGYVHPEDRDIFAVSHSTNGRPCESDREGREEDRREKFAGISKKEVFVLLERR